MTKSLSSNKMDFYDYLSEARAVIDQLNKQFYGGPFPTLLNRFRNNIGITYYGELPCYTTFSTVHLITKDSSEFFCSKATDLSYEIGYHSGLSGGYLYRFAQSFYADRSVFDVSAFETRSNDRRFEDMVKTANCIGCKNDAIFFFLSELLMLLVSVDVLFKAGFFTDAVFIKYSCLSLDHVARALQIFTTFTRTHRSLVFVRTGFCLKSRGLFREKIRNGSSARIRCETHSCTTTFRRNLFSILPVAHPRGQYSTLPAITSWDWIRKSLNRN